MSDFDLKDFSLEDVKAMYLSFISSKETWASASEASQRAVDAAELVFEQRKAEHLKNESEKARYSRLATRLVEKIPELAAYVIPSETPTLAVSKVVEQNHTTNAETNDSKKRLRYPADLAEQVVAFLETTNTVKTDRELTDFMSSVMGVTVPSKTAYNKLAEFFENGYIKRVRKSIYTITGLHNWFDDDDNVKEEHLPLKSRGLKQNQQRIELE